MINLGFFLRFFCCKLDPCSLIPRVSYLEQVEEDNMKGNWLTHVFLEKQQLNRSSSKISGTVAQRVER